MWFSKKQKSEDRHAIEKKAKIEIVAAKDANQKATEQAKKDAEDLKNLLERNHFSVTLYIAVGGKDPRKQTGKKRNA